MFVYFESTFLVLKKVGSLSLLSFDYAEFVDKVMTILRPVRDTIVTQKIKKGGG